MINYVATTVAEAGSSKFMPQLLLADMTMKSDAAAKTASHDHLPFWLLMLLNYGAYYLKPDL